MFLRAEAVNGYSRRFFTALQGVPRRPVAARRTGDLAETTALVHYSLVSFFAGSAFPALGEHARQRFTLRSGQSGGIGRRAGFKIS